MIRILIADDHPIVRSGLKQILADEPDLAVLGEAEDAEQVVHLLARQNWDVLVLDLNMPGKTGLEVLREVKRQRPQLPVLVLTVHPEEQYAIQVMKAGAAGYLTKGSVPGELVKAIRKVQAGGKYVSPTLAERLAFALAAGEQQQPHELLTQREYQVFRLLASGKTVSEVAGLLSLSVKTVSTHRAHILEKMNLSTIAELMHYAIRNQLAE